MMMHLQNSTLHYLYLCVCICVFVCLYLCSYPYDRYMHDDAFVKHYTPLFVFVCLYLYICVFMFVYLCFHPYDRHICMMIHLHTPLPYDALMPIHMQSHTAHDDAHDDVAFARHYTRTRAFVTFHTVYLTKLRF